MKFSILIALICSLTHCIHENKDQEFNQEIENIYRESQRDFKAKDYKNALKSFKLYLNKTKININDERRVFWVINKAGYIFLKIMSDPKAAIVFFKQFREDLRLTEAQQATVSEWISAAKDLEEEKFNFGEIPQDRKLLFSEGKNFFLKGMSKKEFTADKRGNIELWVARRYLSPFITHFDSDPKIIEALVMMGRIQVYLKSDREYWENNFYLKEAIRRSPGTKLAKEAWGYLNSDIQWGYSGSSGSNIPPSMVRMLIALKEIAFTKKQKVEEI